MDTAYLFALRSAAVARGKLSRQIGRGHAACLEQDGEMKEQVARLFDQPLLLFVRLAWRLWRGDRRPGRP